MRTEDQSPIKSDQKAPGREFTDAQIKEWTISSLPERTARRDWVGYVEMCEILKDAYPGMEKQAEAAAMLAIGIRNGIIEVAKESRYHYFSGNGYRIKPQSGKTK